MNRTLHYALLLSLALHGVILFGLSVPRKPAMRDLPPARLEARLVEPLPPAPPPPTVESVKPAPPPAPVVKPARRPKPPPPVAKRAPEPIVPAEPAPQPEPRAPSSPAQPAPASPSTARIEPSPAVPGPSPEQLEARSQEQYRLQLLDAARSHNRYPPLARENNWEGEVRVRMVIGPSGELASLSVQSTSGHPVLDRQAVEMFRRAQAAVPLPAALRGKEFTLELRAIYNLKDQVSG